MAADAIREFVRRKYIDPVRKAGAAVVTVRAGDVHKNMRLVDAMPAVCGAIGSESFRRNSG